MVGTNIGKPTYGDNCSVASLTYALTGATIRNSAATGIHFADTETYNVGVTTVTYTVTDASGRTKTCFHSVWIKNLAAPQFAATCPADVSVAATSGQCTAIVSVPAPSISNPCTEAYTITNNSLFKTSDADASGTYPVGVTTVTWIITNASGVAKTCTQTITVNDLPLVCPGNISKPADFGQSYATGIIVPEPGFSKTCSGLKLTWTMVLPNGTSSASSLTGINLVTSPGTFNLGTTTITYTLTHATGVEESCPFTIVITGKPKITCLPAITQAADNGDCNYTVNPGVPTLDEGVQPITWTWVIDGPVTMGEATGTFVGSAGTPGPPNIGLYDFKVGTSTVRWTAANISGSAVCTQIVTVTDKQAPTFTLSATPLSYCVSNIQSAVYNPNPNLSILPAYDDLTTPRPEYYSFIPPSTIFDLNKITNNFNDNCCNDDNLIIHWEIIFAPTPNPATAAHGAITKPPITGQIGQPSLYPSVIDFPGDGVTFLDVIHQINYWLEDCNGNPLINPVKQTVNIIIKPRPKITKNF